MKISYLLIFIFFPFFDLFWELIFQYRSLADLKFILEKSKDLFSKDMHHILEHNIGASVKHLLIGIFLTSFASFILFITVNLNLRSMLLRYSKTLVSYYKPFMGVSSFEMFILQLQCSILRYFESRWIYDIFITNNFLRWFWLPTVVGIIAPVEIRFKVYMEKTFHNKSNLINNILHATMATSFPIILFYYYSLFGNLSKIDVSSDLPNFKNCNFYYNNVSDSTCNVFLATSFFNNNFIIQKPENSHEILEVFLNIAFLDFYKIKHKSGLFLHPFTKNLIFLFFFTIANKHFLKSLCSNDIGHVCASLILEEYINVGWFKFMTLLFNLSESKMIYNNDINISNYIKNISNFENRQKFITLLSEAFILKMENHEPCCSSNLYQLTNNTTGLIERLKNIINRSK